MSIRIYGNNICSILCMCMLSLLSSKWVVGFNFGTSSVTSVSMSNPNRNVNNVRERRAFVSSSPVRLRSTDEDSDALNLDDVTPPNAKVNTNAKSILQAAADLTTSTYQRLGTKSIGVDYGLVRTGLAVSLGYSYTPLAIVSNLNNTQLCSHIVKLAEAEEASQIVVGLPFHKNGTEAEQTILTRNFATQLHCAVYAHFGPTKMPIYLWDERYTSKEAAARIKSQDPRANTYKELDAEAACIILEYYYADDGQGAILVDLPEDEEIRNAVHSAWEMKQEEERRELEALTKWRMMDSKDKKREMIERAKILEEQLALERGDGGKKKKKKKKKKKR